MSVLHSNLGRGDWETLQGSSAHDRCDDASPRLLSSNSEEGRREFASATLQFTPFTHRRETACWYAQIEPVDGPSCGGRRCPSKRLARF